MSDLKSILNEEYSKMQTTLNIESLLEMVAEVMELPISQYLVPDVIQEKQKGRKSQKLTIDLIPTLPITEIGWGSLATPDGEGKEVRTAAGQDLAQFLNNIAPGGELSSKIEALNAYYENPVPEAQGDTPGQQIKNVISNLVFYKTLTNIITNFNASSAGFAFESFLAVLLDAETGKQIPAGGAGTIADIVISQGGRPISLKLYKEGSLKVGGSYKQLVDDLTGKGEIDAGFMEYVVVTKDLDGSGLEQTGKLNFYAFNFTRDNFIQILGLKPKELDLIKIPTKFSESIEDLRAGLQNAGPGGLEDFLTLPAATFVDLKPVVDAFINIANELAAAKGIEPAKMNLAAELANIVDMKDYTFVSNNKRFGYVNFPVKLKNQMLGQMELEDAEIAVINQIIDVAYQKATTARKKAGARGSARAEKFKELKFMPVKKSLKVLENLKQDPQLYNIALQTSQGYLNNKQFELSKGQLTKLPSIADQNNLFPYGNQFEVGVINIGAQGLQDMLDASVGAVNDQIFSIFRDLKDLSSNLNAYVAGGLEDDSLAGEAKADAEDIATGTEKVRDSD
tara:strand:- start:604 stop:2301 length:1698 start_codon:yes stop_codon:yes gene_type:complete